MHCCQQLQCDIHLPPSVSDQISSDHSSSCLEKACLKRLKGIWAIMHPFIKSNLYYWLNFMLVSQTISLLLTFLQ